MSNLNPYISFNGNCREAMNFYKECIGGNLILRTVEGSPMEANCPGAMKNNILHSSLVKDDLVIMATDMQTPEGYIPGNNMALSVNCGSEEEINTLYEKLSAGGKILDPLKKQFWGALFCAFNDKFGTRWMLNYETEKPGKSS